MSVTSEDWLQAQHSVLGAALLDVRIAARVITETEERDYSGACRTVYTAMHGLYAKGIAVDPVSVKNVLGAGYTDFLMQLMEITVTTANADYHMELVREQSRVLSIRDIGQQLAGADTTDAVRELLGEANGLMVDKQAQKAATMMDCFTAFMERPAGKVRYLPWPIRPFSEQLRVKPGRFVLIGAEPSVGKTAFGLQCAYLWAREKKVGFFSLETDEETLFYRLLSSVVGIPLDRIQDNDLTQQDAERICQASQEILSRRLEFVPAAGLTTTDIHAKIVASQYDIILIDYIQLIPAKGRSRYEIVTNVSIELHQLAQRLKVTIVALAQLSRSEDDHTPRNSDLRESGQLEQDADIIIMMKLAKQSDPAGPRHAYVTKNKEGELFMTPLAFDGKHQTFSRLQQTGEVVERYVNDGKKARRLNKQAAQAAQMEQMEMLPDNIPVPFRD